jgi:opacity protein-like surface antigen
MRLGFVCATLLAAGAASAATPINGWYAGGFGGYAYVPTDIHTTRFGLIRSNATYFSGFDAGGYLGYKSNPMRYEGELSYVNANLKNFTINNVQQTGVSGYNDAILALANVYYDFPNYLNAIQPFLGVGVGYGWVQAKLDSTGPFGRTQYIGSNSVVAYQAAGGFIYNFSESYALNLGYRYVATWHANNLGTIFQAQTANLGAIYRFDGSNYK